MTANASATDLDGASVLIATLNCFGVESGSEYSLLLRDGRILCALPADKKTALKLLSLYQPQRLKAKVLAAAFKICAGLGLHPRILKRWRMPTVTIATNATNANNTTTEQQRTSSYPTSDANLLGVFVGTSGHLCERAVVCLLIDGDWQICKVAFGEIGHSILSHEAEMLRGLNAEFSNIPRLSDFTCHGDASLLSMPFQEGSSWESSELSPLFDLLVSWSGRGEAQALSSFPEWSIISTALSAFPEWQPRLLELGNLKLQASIRHGDLTRPNLRTDSHGKLLVHDWERGAMVGVPGLDLAHFLTQDKLFRTRMSPSEVVNEVLGELRKPQISELLVRLGWSGRESELLAMSLAYNTGAGYFKHSALIDCVTVS